MHLVKAYIRAIALLATEGGLVVGLVTASVGIGLVQLAEPVIFGKVVDALSRYSEALPLIGYWALLGVFSIVASMTVAVSADRLAHRQRQAALAIAFDRSITLPLTYHATHGSGTIVRNMLAGTDALFGVWLSFLREQVVAVVTVGFLVPIAFWMDWRLASILAVLAALYFAMNFYVIQRTATGQSNVEQYSRNVFGRVGDVVGNVTVVQSYARLMAESTALRGMMRELLNAQYPVLTWWAVLTVLTRAAGTIAMVAIFAAGAWLAQEGKVSVGHVVTFVGFAGLLISKLDQIAGFVGRIFIFAPTIATFFELIDLKEEVRDRPGAIDLGTPRGDVSFEDVSYRFPNSALGVTGISFAAKAGETIALVGPTGCGKTTTLGFLQRLREPESGRVLIDGVDVRDITLTSLRHAISVVFQDAGLFNRTIADNIRIGKPGASDAEVERAARMAEAHEFIMAKPGGYKFIIGERGSSLSGGERQRVAVARAILKDAPILILDEATSALDNETEFKLKLALDAVRKNRTTFIIAHRLSTIQDVDKILVLEKGRIVQSGTFDELARQEGLFARLVDLGALRQDAAATDRVDTQV
ncbi:MAG: glucan ABC transporter ATP-binding protein/ permease [Beijerinckiaceae bacterium]